MRTKFIKIITSRHRVLCYSVTVAQKVRHDQELLTWLLRRHSGSTWAGVGHTGMVSLLHIQPVSLPAGRTSRVKMPHETTLTRAAGAPVNRVHFRNS